MVDYSKWDRLDLGDSDSDAGEAEGARKGDPLREALFADMISLARKKEAAETKKMAEATYGPVPPPNQPRENTNAAEKTERIDDNERQLQPQQPMQACSVGSSNDTHEQGKRFIRYPNGDLFEGELEEGKLDGVGVCRFANGDVYDGEWRVCDGEWRGAKQHGFGTFTTADGVVYKGQWAEGKYHGKGKLTGTVGGMYDGEWKGGEKNGWGKSRWGNGNVYEGQWKDGEKHGKGTFKWTNGDVYVGGFVEGYKHGRGTKSFANGDVYDGEFKDGAQHGRGVYKWAIGDVYVGEFREDVPHGWGTMTSLRGVYEGEWARGKQHGKGTMKMPTGEIVEGEFKEGMPTSNTMIRSSPSDNARGMSLAPFHSNAGSIVAPNTGKHRAKETRETRAFSHERLPRSQRSQQRRLQNNTAVRKCGHCGVDDQQFKLQVCLGCNLVLYCSEACQKAASRSHRRICSIISQLPSRDSDELELVYDKETMVDLDAGLRYATKYMDSLKLLGIDLAEMTEDGAVKLSAKRLISLFKSKKGALDSVFWLQKGSTNAVPGISLNGLPVWRELHGLKQLRLEYMIFNDVHHICDIIGQQKVTLMVLCLPWLRIHWHKAKPRRTVAQAIGSCKSITKLRLSGCVLLDSDLKVMLHNLPDLRVLYLKRDTRARHEFTDNTCGIIARKCPGLQELNLDEHNQLSVKGIRKIFEGCIQLRSFYTTTRKLSGKDIQSLLGIAPQLMYLSLELDISEEELDQIIEATGGRVVFQLSNTSLFGPKRVSVKTRGRYECQMVALNEIWSNRLDPVVANEWEDMLVDEEGLHSKLTYKAK